MIEPDTIKLLRECDSGVKMGIVSIHDVLDNVKSPELQSLLEECKTKHEKLESEIRDYLNEYHDEGKDPSPIAKGMSWVKTNVRLTVNESDGTIADLMTDGCNMGVKSLNQYLNQYGAADERSKDITKRLIKIEEKLSDAMHDYL